MFFLLQSVSILFYNRVRVKIKIPGHAKISYQKRIKMTEFMFQKWLKETNEGLKNEERYADILKELRVAFDAGFQAKLIYSAEEYLQK